MRRDEDLQATLKIGATSQYFDLPDCIYRRGIDGQPLYLDIFTEPHPSESSLPDQIAKTIHPLLEPGDEIICQPGIGGHVDHILTRRAAERLDRPLWFTADLPYTFQYPEALEDATAGLQVSLYPISDTGLKRWVEAILEYESQLSSLFESTDQVRKSIIDYYQSWNGFPLWRSK